MNKKTGTMDQTTGTVCKKLEPSRASRLDTKYIQQLESMGTNPMDTQGQKQL
jgi:hypothetical protein